VSIKTFDAGCGKDSEVESAATLVPIGKQFQKYWKAYVQSHIYWLAVMKDKEEAYNVVKFKPKIGDALIVLVSDPSTIDPTTDCPNRDWALVQVVQIVAPFLVVCQLERCEEGIYKRTKKWNQGKLEWIPNTEYHIYNSKYKKITFTRSLQ
jgi:hypothetical protein